MNGPMSRAVTSRATIAGRENCQPLGGVTGGRGGAPPAACRPRVASSAGWMAFIASAIVRRRGSASTAFAPWKRRGPDEVADALVGRAALCAASWQADP